jgi:hypothetical protein
MVTQTKISSNGESPPLGKNLSGFTRDVLTLAELQFKLLAVDCRDARASVGRGILLLGAGFILALAVIPVLVAALGFSLVELAGWSHAAAFGTAALVSLLLALVSGWYGWSRIKSASSTFQRSRAELRETFLWIKESLRHETSEPEPLCRRM